MTHISLKALRELATEWKMEATACLNTAATNGPHYSHLHGRVLTVNERKVRAAELKGCADDLLSYLSKS